MPVFEGINVLDFSWAGVGPITTKYLADYGATVIRVESRAHLDALRTAPPFVGGVPEPNHAAYYALYSANKLGMALNMKHPRAKEVVRRLIFWADILAESFAAGVMEKWGWGYKQITEIKPNIIMYRTCMQGQTGPHSHLRGTGVNMVGLAGLVALTGWSDRIPSQPYGPYTDAIAPRFGAAMLIAALDYRRKTGKGQLLDLSQYETGVHFLAPLLLDYFTSGQIANRAGNFDPVACPHNAYPCRGEDKWCVIAVSTRQEWVAFCRVIGCPGWTKEEKFATPEKRKQNETELDSLVAEWTRQHTAEEVMTLMQPAGVPAGVVPSAKDLFQDPQLKHRYHFWFLEHQEMGQIAHLRQSANLSKTPAEARAPAPCLGEHTQEICLNLLGMSEQEYNELLVEGVFD